MSRIYKRSDRIKVRIDNITVTLAPLSFDQKTEAQDLMAKGTAKSDIRMLSKGIATLVKYAVKNIEGVEDGEGKPYQLEFDGDSLSDSCIDDLLNLEIQEKLQSTCLSLCQGIPKQILDAKGNPVAGVELIQEKKRKPANP
jgi:hypothetical protein